MIIDPILDKIHQVGHIVNALIIGLVLAIQLLSYFVIQEIPPISDASGFGTIVIHGFDPWSIESFVVFPEVSKPQMGQYVNGSFF
jgi:hypothetical protein